MTIETIETRNARRAAEADARCVKANAYAAARATYFPIRDAYCADGCAANKAAYEAARVRWLEALAAMTA